ncbi:hypothetical protein [Aureivirga sp. CE67]|uniref:hypothetical protein n=1 Tax=Aureivirga sp. CE67 TaxID=1788983 RepID=UPI0018CA33BF|nr:hypothetical protein [Aureivirga sp. CE67]
MKTTLSILTFLIIQISFCQIATIKDPDGYTNVRKAPNGKSKIIHKVYEGEIFFYEYHEIENGAKWIPVYIEVKDSKNEIEGFIHISRLLFLKDAKPYNGNDFHFKYHLSPFDATNRKIEKQEDKWVVSIDGQRPWGIDGYLPHIQVDSIDVKINGKKINIDKHYFQDIFEVRNEFKIIKTGEYYIVYQLNSDGAGGYFLAWVFDKNGLKQKLVGSLI